MLKDATARLARLRELEAGPVCHPTALDVQVAELKAKLAVVEAERDAQDAEMRGSPSVVDPDSQDPVPKRPCRREEFIPNCDEEMPEWMEDRHKHLQVAMVAGHLPVVARVSHLLTKAAQEWQQLIQQQSMMPSEWSCQQAVCRCLPQSQQVQEQSDVWFWSAVRTMPAALCLNWI